MPANRIPRRCIPALILLLLLGSFGVLAEEPTAAAPAIDQPATENPETAIAKGPAGKMPAEALVAPSGTSAAAVAFDPMDARLQNGSYGIAVGDAKEAQFTAARVGLVDGTLYLLAAKMKGFIHNPAVTEQALAIPLTEIRAAGIKRYGFNRQLHVDLGDRVALVAISGGAFIDRKATQALFEALVAAGVSEFSPKRFVRHPYQPPVTIYY